jgi:Holliday junction resolvase RusA-like endonuclease
MRIAICVPGLPVAQPRQRHRVVTSGGRSFATNFTPRNDPVNAFKAAVQLAAQQAYQGPPLTGPASLTLTFFFPRPKGMCWKKRPMPREFKSNKPDWDNLGKSVCDALTGLLWGDDSQLAKIIVEKWIASGDEQPRTEIVVEPIGQERKEPA